jgi:hypothetical protein
MAVEEYDSWLVGACLRDLHLHFELFLDDLWEYAKMVKRFGSQVPTDFILHDDQFRNITSVSTKYKKVADMLARGEERSEQFRSFHFLRNCLTHGAGYVRKRDCNTDLPSLRVQWLGQDVLVADAEKEVPINEAIWNKYVTPEGGAKIILKITERCVEANLGEKAALSVEQMAEVCWFYTSTADLLVDELERLLPSAGMKTRTLQQ